jgi:hypothetical protein
MGGQDLGPGKLPFLMCVDSFRRFLVDIGSIYNPEYNIDISHGLPKIADYGNI